MKFQTFYEFLVWLSKNPNAESKVSIGEMEFSSVDEAVGVTI